MAECSEISLLIGPFEDGELEPHEMQEVARHLAACSSCEAVLNDYGLIGRELRSAATIPPLDGFAQGVLARIGTFPPSIRSRLGAWLDEFIGELSGTLAIGALAAAVAVVTAVVVTPYAQQRIMAKRAVLDVSNAVAKLDSAPSAADPTTPVGTTEGGTAFEGRPESPALAMASPMFTPVAGDSHAVISKLESEIPSVAVWSEPQNDTTVIWLPEQQQ